MATVLDCAAEIVGSLYHYPSSKFRNFRITFNSSCFLPFFIQSWQSLELIGTFSLYFQTSRKSSLSSLRFLKLLPWFSEIRLLCSILDRNSLKKLPYVLGAKYGGRVWVLPYSIANSGTVNASSWDCLVLHCVPLSCLFPEFCVLLTLLWVYFLFPLPTVLDLLPKNQAYTFSYLLDISVRW